jgi:hypothetical protein
MTVTINYDTRAARYVVRVNDIRIGTAPTRQDANELADHYIDVEQMTPLAIDDALDYMTARSETTSQ